MQNEIILLTPFLAEKTLNPGAPLVAGLCAIIAGVWHLLKLMTSDDDKKELILIAAICFIIGIAFLVWASYAMDNFGR